MSGSPKSTSTARGTLEAWRGSFQSSSAAGSKRKDTRLQQMKEHVQTSSCSQEANPCSRVDVGTCNGKGLGSGLELALAMTREHWSVSSRTCLSSSNRSVQSGSADGAWKVLRAECSYCPLFKFSFG